MQGAGGENQHRCLFICSRSFADSRTAWLGMEEAYYERHMVKRTNRWKAVPENRNIYSSTAVTFGCDISNLLFFADLTDILL